MQRLNDQQLQRVQDELKSVQFQIKQLENSISDDNVSQLKKDFIGDQIKQLIVVKNYLYDLKNNKDSTVK